MSPWLEQTQLLIVGKSLQLHYNKEGRLLSGEVCVALIEKIRQFFWQCNSAVVRVSCPGSQLWKIDTAQLMLGTAQSPKMLMWPCIMAIFALLLTEEHNKVYYLIPVITRLQSDKPRALPYLALTPSVLRDHEAIAFLPISHSCSSCALDHWRWLP